MLQPDTWNRIEEDVLRAWSVIGPIVGIIIGAYISNRNERKHWIADNKKQEYREIITALVDAYRAVLESTAPMVAYGPEEQRKFWQSEQNLLITLNTRIFIADEVSQLKIQERWLEAVGSYRNVHHRRELSDKMNEIKYDLIDSAKDLLK
jgi:hypothetical protein